MGFNKLFVVVVVVVVVAFTFSAPVFQFWGFASVLLVVFARPCVPLYLLLVVNFQFQSVTHSGNFYQACFLRGFVTVVLLKSGLLSSHAGAWSQPGLLDPFAKLAWLARRSVEPAWLLDPCVSLLVLLAEWSILLENYIAGLAVFARRSVEPAQHLGTCRLSTLPAPCCVEKLLPGWLSSHAGAWSQPGLLDPFAKLA